MERKHVTSGLVNSGGFSCHLFIRGNRNSTYMKEKRRTVYSSGVHIFSECVVPKYLNFEFF